MCYNKHETREIGFGAVAGLSVPVRKHRNLVFRCFLHRNIPDAYGWGAACEYIKAAESLNG